MTEDTITISKADLQALIREGIAQAAGKQFTPSSLFNEVAITGNDISAINNRHQLATGGFRNCSTYSSNHYTDNFDMCRHDGVFFSQIHDQLRHLTLALVGETKNRDVIHADYGFEQESYARMRDLFLSLYEQHVTDLKKQGA